MVHLEGTQATRRLHICALRGHGYLYRRGLDAQDLPIWILCRDRACHWTGRALGLRSPDLSLRDKAVNLVCPRCHNEVAPPRSTEGAGVASFACVPCIRIWAPPHSVVTLCSLSPRIPEDDERRRRNREAPATGMFAREGG